MSTCANDTHGAGASDLAPSADQLCELERDARRGCQSALERVVDLLAEVNPVTPTVSTHTALGGAALARAARRVGRETGDRRQLAQMLLAAALLNHDNPHWNPADAATDRANHDDPLVALLQRAMRAQATDH